MKLELFPQSKSKPVLLLYDGTPEDVTALQVAFYCLSDGTNEEIAIHMLPGFVSVNGCELLVGVNRTNKGVNERSDNHFTWHLTADRWRDIAEMVENFKAPWRAGHAFLDTHSKISIIISSGRGW